MTRNRVWFVFFVGLFFCSTIFTVYFLIIENKVGMGIAGASMLLGFIGGGLKIHKAI